MRYLRTEKLRSFHLRPFIVLTITKRARYKAKSEATCRVSVLKLVSPNQPDSQQLWGQLLMKTKCGWVRGISFLKTVNTLLSESTEGRTGHKGGRAFARTCIHHEVRSAEVPKAFFTCTQQASRSMSM